MIEKPSKIEPKWIEIGAANAGQRIDNFLLSHLKGVPKSCVYRLLRTGQVRVNKGRVKAQYRLSAGDLVRIPPLALPAVEETKTTAARAMGRRLEKHFLYQDDWLLVVSKPAGMPVHGGSGLSGGVIEGLRLVYPEAESWELVHRLDKDTSGCLLIAKRKQVLRSLHQALREGQVDKRYLALLAGVWLGRHERVEAPLRKFVLQGGERFVRVDPEGKPAQTEFKQLAHLAGATLVEARLLTGRTHQIRVHAAYLGHPVVGDPRYGDEQANRSFHVRGLKRLFLHAWRMSFCHPVSGTWLELKAPLDPELLNLLAREGWRGEN